MNAEAADHRGTGERQIHERDEEAPGRGTGTSRRATPRGARRRGGHDDRGGEKGQPDGEGVRLRDRRDVGAPGLRERLTKTDASGRTRIRRERGGGRDGDPATALDSVRRRRANPGSRREAPAEPARPALECVAAKTRRTRRGGGRLRWPSRPPRRTARSFVTMRERAISVFIGGSRDEAIDPYFAEPPRANASVTPVRSGGRRFGRMTRRNACRREAPRTPAASRARSGPGARAGPRTTKGGRRTSARRSSRARTRCAGRGARGTGRSIRSSR